MVLPAPRALALDTLSRRPFDLLVVGGGINGAGIARDAVLRGIRTALVEQGDFASGTSSRSSKLIHGGLRYLEQGHIRLVLEACRERERLRRLAPHLVRPQRFVFPIYEGGPVGRAKLAAGLFAYDVLAGLWNVHRHCMLSARGVATAEPSLRASGLRGAGVYWDCWTDDARLVVETMLSASEEGATVASYVALTGFLKEGGRLVGARARDRLHGTEIEIRAHVVVNATGPWAEAVAALDEPGHVHLRLTKGVHLVVPRARVGNRDAIVLHAVQDGRVLFVIPWGAQTLIGTTDTDHPGGPDAPPEVEPSDVAYLLDTVNHYFPAARLAPTDVVSAFAGLRPLIAPGGGASVSPSDVSREEEVFVSPAGLVTLAGGKLTTYRRMAAGVVDRVVAELHRHGDRRRLGGSRTHDLPLPGATANPAVLADAALSRNGHGLAPAVVEHLADRYGRRLGELLDLVGRQRALGAPIVPSLPDARAEVAVAVEREWACTVEDVLRRRTHVALQDPASGTEVADDVAALMAGHLGWDSEAVNAAAVTYREGVLRARRRWR